jgi:hypothetical protein
MLVVQATFWGRSGVGPLGEEKGATFKCLAHHYSIVNEFGSSTQRSHGQLIHTLPGLYFFLSLDFKGTIGLPNWLSWITNWYASD